MSGLLAIVARRSLLLTTVFLLLPMLLGLLSFSTLELLDVQRLCLWFLPPEARFLEVLRLESGLKLLKNYSSFSSIHHRVFKLLI